MPSLSKPTLTPTPVPAVPTVIKLAFVVTPGPSVAQGIAVEYVLESCGAQYAAAPAPPGMRDDERTGSTPTTPDLVPDRREGRTILDRYPKAKFGDTLNITRAISLERAPGTPGLSTFIVTAFDIDGAGARIPSITHRVTFGA